MVIATDKLIDEFYSKIKDKYPELSYEAIKKICKLPFYYVRKKMESNSFPLIHIKYLGKLLVYPGKVKAYIKGFNIKLSKRDISQEDYDTNTKPLKDYLIKNNEEIPD